MPFAVLALKVKKNKKNKNPDSIQSCPGLLYLCRKLKDTSDATWNNLPDKAVT